MSSETSVTFLFCHGAGFCQNIWLPIVKRLQQSPLLQEFGAAGGRVDIVTFDLPYHGTNRDVSVAPKLRLENPESPRVDHPASQWAQWTVAAVQRQLEQIRAKQGDKRAPIIGIGHSMGAAAMWAAEAADPGSFDGLILFEPMCLLTRFRQDNSIDFLISLTLRRRTKWDTFEEAEADILQMRNFARWHPESLRAYIQGAVVRVRPENNVVDPDSKFALACHPHIEGAIYTGDLIRLSPKQVARVRCPITFQYGERTMLFFPEYRQPLVDKFPHLYSIAEPVPKATHALVMEDPDTVSSRITDSLAKLPVFRNLSTGSSRL